MTIDKKTERIFIGILCFQNASAQVLEDYIRLFYHFGRRMPKYEFFVGIKTKTEQFRARNALVSAAIEVGADWLLMLDDDQIFDVEGATGKPGEGIECYNFLQKLIDHDVDIVGPIYYQRGGTANPVVMAERHGSYFFMQDSELTGGLQEVGVQGGGCILIKMKVFDRLNTPWFEPEHTYGTDIQLCRQAKAAGFKVYTDSSIHIGHLYNDSVIIHEGNKDQYREDSTAQSSMNAIAGWAAQSVLNSYRMDAMKYLDIDDESSLKALWDNYDVVATQIAKKHVVGSKPYYSAMGPEQLARQVLFHESETGKMWMSFMLANVSTNRKSMGLDYGCGSAPIGFEFLRRGHEIYFMDVDGSSAYEFLKWRVKEYGLQDRAFFNDLPEAGSCDYVMMNDVLEHLSNWAGIVSSNISCLKNYGVFITNYLLLVNDGINPEHVNWNCGEFVKFMYDQDMSALSDTIWQKRVPE